MLLIPLLSPSSIDDVADLVCVSFSSSSWLECRDRNDPKILEGLPGFCSVRGRNFGLAGRSPWVIRSTSGLDGVVGEEDADVMKKEAGLRFFLSMTGEVADLSSFSSFTGVRDGKVGRKSVKLFRRRRSISF